MKNFVIVYLGAKTLLLSSMAAQSGAIPWLAFSLMTAASLLFVVGGLFAKAES